MTETKTPKPGEWWIRNDDGTIAYVCGFDPDGAPVWFDADEELHNSMARFFIQEFHHEPRCDSFDWVPVSDSDAEAMIAAVESEVDPGEGYELLPVGTVLEDGDQYEISTGWRDTKSPGGTVDTSDCYRRKIKPAEVWPKWYRYSKDMGFTFRVTSDWKYKGFVDDQAVSNGDWSEAVRADAARGCFTELTEAEALARMAPADPYPHYYESTEEEYAYLRRDSEESGQLVLLDGTDFGESTWYPHDGAGRKRLTKAEALALVTPVDPDDIPLNPVPGKVAATGTVKLTPVTTGNAPADTFKITPATAVVGEFKFGSQIPDYKGETPDDFVEITDSGHVLRAGVDQLLVLGHGGFRWEYSQKSAGSCMGDVGVSKCRCRRKDLPAVESPDDWVVQDRVPARPGIDERSYADDTTLTLWEDASCIHWDVPPMHGMAINGTTLQLRCRRKDLPVAVPAVTRVPVRLFFDKDDGVVIQADEKPDDRFTEIMYDADGFYVEGKE